MKVESYVSQEAETLSSVCPAPFAGRPWAIRLNVLESDMPHLKN